MSFLSNGYYYDSQFRTYILQFMAIFTDMQVSVGTRHDVEPELISVPIHYAAPDRVAAAIQAGNTQNLPLRLPVMSAYLRSIAYEPSRAQGSGAVVRQSMVPTGGMIPNDIKVVYQRKPLPVKLTMELNLYASNTDQLFKMLEQILPLFEPQLTIQTSDSVFDSARTVTVELTNVMLDNNYPIGTERRTIQSTLTFEIDGWISMPADVRTNYVNKIFLRVGTVSTNATTSEEIIAELDGGGFKYDLVKEGSILDLSGSGELSK